MTRIVVLVVLIALALASSLSAQDRPLQPIPGQGPRRLALVVGNAAYPTRNQLHNPLNDAQAVQAALRELGFVVQLAANTALRGLRGAVDTFLNNVRRGDVALFYYSGHGVQVEGENYLVPIDFQAERESDVPYAAYPAGRALEGMQAAGSSLSILILDACRDNPFRATRASAKGLAEMRMGRGSFIAFATAPGSTASDNAGESNGLFTKYYWPPCGSRT
jgi:uncharacterized caspase-like protein